MCKVYGFLAHGEKVTGQNPKVAKQDKKKSRGKAHKRMRYNRSFLIVGRGKHLGAVFYRNLLIVLR
ncbi:hypothetical protein MKW98_001962 [Papaver atlanticum]|uniref:40S ribosomal protein S30 n=1 Tax=Papaver atlanticum TaxID=357466 RepID=A0AAD4SQ95_9MAGN|nr:hypothetical protein MKW98_001962 [Papaver atlanticum]